MLMTTRRLPTSHPTRITQAFAYSSAAWRSTRIASAMPLMKREEWQDLAREVDWTFSYADDDAIFPEWQSGTGKVPRDAWCAWEESYKISYPEYVSVQREKEASAFAVKAALQRSNIFDRLDDGWKSCAKVHFGSVSLAEYTAFIAEARMARFGLAG